MLAYAKESGNPKDVDQSDEFFDDTSMSKINWHDQVLLNRPSKVILTLVVAAVVVPLLVYQFVLSASLDLPPSDGYSTGSCLIPRSRRIPCGYGNISAELCHLQCCYDLENNLCFHRVPSRFSYLMDRSWTEETSLHPRVPTDPFGNQANVQTLRIVVDEISNTHVAFEIYDPTKKPPRNGERLTEKSYEYEVFSPEMDLIVRSGNRTLFEMDRGPLVAADNIWELSFLLTNETMYGLDVIPLSPGVNKVIYNSKGNPTTVPLIYARSNGSFHGFLLENETPTEFNVLEENHMLIRTITDESIRFHVFVGPTPDGIMREVMALSGGKPKFSYWMLGAHFCRESSLTPLDQYEDLTEFLSEASDEDLPVDSHCGTAPLALGTLGLTESVGQANSFGDVDGLRYPSASTRYVRDTQQSTLGAQAVVKFGAHFVPHLSPYISVIEIQNSTEVTPIEDMDNFTNGLIRHFDTDLPYIGHAGSLRVVYPDYSANSSELLSHVWPFDVEMSGIILENNWPLDETENFVNETETVLPYFSKSFEAAFNNTLPWNTTHVNPELHRSHHLYHHNSYGEHFTAAVRQFTDDNITIFSTSKWMNSKIATNRQNVATSWTNLRKDLIEAAIAGVSGNWLRSSPICGDTDSFDSELQTHLCVKWYMAATYMPLIRVHSKDVRKDPLSFVGMDKYYMIQALNRRLALLPYFSTVLASGPLLRPMFYQFPDEIILHDLGSQFSVGDSLLIVPNLLPQQSLLNVWVPPGCWYEMWSGLKMVPNSIGVVTMPATTADFLTLIRGGDIVVLQEDVRPTAESTRLLSPYSFIIALSCHNATTNDTESEDIANHTECRASGELLMSEGMTLHFTADGESMTIVPVGDDFATFCDVSSGQWAGTTKAIKIYGLDDSLNNFDTYRYFEVNLFLCAMQMTGQTVVRFV